MKRRVALLLPALILTTALVPALAAPGDARYEITVTNIAPAQTFTPILGVAHTGGIALFELGSPAGSELESLAEAGNVDPLNALLSTVPDLVGGTAISGGLLSPGATATFALEAPRGFRYLSLAAMLIPTNDTFMAVDSMPLPVRRGEVVAYALGFDAGTEANDQNCANMPGPRCGGAALSDPADSDEGFVAISNGFHELGSTDGQGNEILSPSPYDWRNPVARVTVRRIGPR